MVLLGLPKEGTGVHLAPSGFAGHGPRGPPRPPAGLVGSAGLYGLRDRDRRVNVGRGQALP